MWVWLMEECGLDIYETASEAQYSPIGVQSSHFLPDNMAVAWIEYIH